MIFYLLGEAAPQGFRAPNWKGAKATRQGCPTNILNYGRPERCARRRVALWRSGEGNAQTFIIDSYLIFQVFTLFSKYQTFFMKAHDHVE
jgi:hypothetical protein